MLKLWEQLNLKTPGKPGSTFVLLRVLCGSIPNYFARETAVSRARRV
jgi:hypothetical protein